MAVGRMALSSLRLERAEASRLAWAFGLSLAVHLLVFGTYQTGKKLSWWQNWHWPAWLQSPRMLTEIVKKKESPRSPSRQEPPLMFVDVSPAQASTEPPPDAKFYSDKNSLAANPNAKKETGVPEINGAQTQVVKTEDVPRDKFTPLQPVRPVTPPQPAQEEMKAKPAQAPGDLTMAKPDLTPRPDEGQDPQSRPRLTVREAKARLQNSRLPGEKMKQEGGVKRYAELTSLDVKSTLFGAYDAALVEAISHHWFNLLDQRDYASDRRGKVVLQFSLHPDGTVTGMNVAENTAGEVLALICEKAVREPAPFAPWPGDMRRMLGDIRHIQFTFYYN